MNPNRRQVIAGLALAPAATLLTTRLTSAAPMTDAYLNEQAALVDFAGNPGSLLIAVVEPDGSTTFGTAGENPDGSTPLPTDLYRVGSNTKTFTATLVLTLVDEGLVDLDAPASDYITRSPVPDTISVRQLLNHTSGLANYLDDEEYYGLVFGDPTRVWTPEEMLALIADNEPAEPGSGFLYANTNYLLLGILIEEITGQDYHEVLQTRIFKPAGLENTYLAGHQTGPDPVGAWEYGVDSYVPMTGDYTSIATATWAAGALVSNAPDLHLFMSALFAGDIVSAEALTEMTATGEYGYGLGLMPLGDNVYGHIGSMPGYSTLLAHSTDTDRTAFWAVTIDAVDTSPAQSDLLTRLGQP